MAVKKSVKKTVKKKKTGKKDLTAKQERFCLAYVANRFNGTRAAREAGYKGADNILAAVSVENLRKPLVSARVKELTNEYLQDKKRLGRDVINELYDLGMRKMSDIVTVDDKGRATVKNFRDMGAAEGAINKIKIKQVDAATNGKVDKKTSVIDSEIEVWLEGKTKPLEILAKHSGQIVEKSEQSINFPNGEFANTREIDLSKVPTDKLKKIQADLRAMEEVIPELKDKR